MKTNKQTTLSLHLLLLPQQLEAGVIEEAKKVCPVPCAVWADIAAPAGAKALCGAEDGVAADTQIVRIAAKYGKQAPAHIGAFVKEIKAALR